MASQILSGSSNPTYTNNTGQNVRLLLNVLNNVTSISWANVTTDLKPFLGANEIIPAMEVIAPIVIQQAGSTGIGTFRVTPPYQLSLSPGESFSAVCDNYNIIVIKEDGS